MHNKTTTIIIQRAIVAALALYLFLPSATISGPLPGKSLGYGQSLADWQELYWRWGYGDVSLPADGNGNAFVNNVVLMPLPSTLGDGTPGSINVTLNAGQSFVLPL